MTTRVYAMTTKERPHQVLDGLSEQEAADALDYLVSRGRDPLARRLDAAPLDDEPLTDEERASRSLIAQMSASAIASMCACPPCSVRPRGRVFSRERLPRRPERRE
jgi:hypothetical protein